VGRDDLGRARRPAATAAADTSTRRAATCRAGATRTSLDQPQLLLAASYRRSGLQLGERGREVSANLAVPWLLGWVGGWPAGHGALDLSLVSAHLTPGEFRSWHGVGRSSKRSAQDRLAYFC